MTDRDKAREVAGRICRIHRLCTIDDSDVPAIAIIIEQALQDARQPWKAAQGSPPPPVGDCRKLVRLVDRDSMAWIGIRAYNHADGTWCVNGVREESATVTHWMDLPEPPERAAATAEEHTLSCKFCGAKYGRIWAGTMCLKCERILPAATAEEQQ